eukprot:CAMPEP_0197542032 /NCGR_PEP_ID=MMETSP1318-20131121/67488_1 /TAXON_ID=552666 /ORGANISM="Partenskyella glossopodia, Strain RCC365" /LENGTH=508 /DNA_ID=CAMNT_0043101269 /DNA_START=517 /DNA_END=2043 /DNA_ORIENTATION=+
MASLFLSSAFSRTTRSVGQSFVSAVKRPSFGKCARGALGSWRTGAVGNRFRTFAEQGSGGRGSAAVAQDEAKRGSKATSKTKMDLNPPKGTRDFYPEDMRQRNWIFGMWRDVATQFGFEEYDAPVLENEDLYIRKAGEEVTQQLYNFEDKGGRRVALRPEMTPSLARMVMAKQRGLSLPLKWFSLPQCWRYERMTRGRRREHFQWNMDVWGVGGVTAEAELLSAVTSFFKKVGLTSEDIGIKVNSRGAIQEILLGLGVPEDKFAQTCVLVDKLEKMPREAIEKEMQGIGLSMPVIDKILEVVQMKDLEQMKALVGDDSKALQDLVLLFELAEAYGYKEWLLFDASVVRGLAYYTGIVFEGFDRKGEFRAICGGGRYDKLLESFGGEALPAVGFGFGDAVIAELLMAKEKMPSFKSPSLPIVVSAFDKSLQPVAAQVASKLREAGNTVDLMLEVKKSKQIFKHTDRVGASYWVNVAPSEWEKGLVVLKDLEKREQYELSIDDAVAKIAS